MNSRQRIEYLQKLTPESLMVQSGRWRFFAYESICSASTDFRLWFCEHGSHYEWYCMCQIPYNLNDDEFRFVAQFKRRDMESWIESAYTA